MHEPSFWWRKGSLRAELLTPLSACYGAVAARRMRRSGRCADLPILCVGNFTLGGVGKTPSVIMLAKMLTKAGEQPFCLSRGYGGNEAGPKRVDPNTDRSAQVGDEALLLAQAAPTIVARERPAGAELAKAQGASVIIMDDGLQNTSIVKDFTLAVIDNKRGIGNGKVFPAGPLRAPLVAQWAATDALLVVGGGNGTDGIANTARARGLPVLHGRLVPDAKIHDALKGRKVLAFAGIGDPQKFFDSAAEVGIEVAEGRAFSDHHRFTAEEAAALIMDAEHSGLALLTTEKDRVRMGGDTLTESLAARSHVLAVTMQVQETDALRKMVVGPIKRHHPT